LSLFALSIVLFAALLHASWNAMVKAGGDRALILAGVALSHALVGGGLILVSAPPAPESWPALIVSTLVHYAYYALLFHAYRLGDLSQVYPISRGLAPMLVAIGALLLVGENLSPMGWAGVALVSFGIWLLSMRSRAVEVDQRAVLVAVALGLTIATYSVADGIGVRFSGSPTGYMGWLFLLEAPVVFAVLGPRILRRSRIDPKTFALGLVGGVFAVSAYGLVLYAKTIAPIGAVSAVRESSVVIAALIGVLLLGERPWKKRIASALIVALGVVALAAS
jgi:drug/metabolite transporter (DMT)-like permease